MTHICLPRSRAPYVCVRIRVARPVDRWGIPVGGTWTATCTECSWTVTDRETAAAACDAGREHTENHERNGR